MSIPHRGSPQWEAMAADPSIFASLSPEVQDQTYAQIAALEAALRAHVMTRCRNGLPITPEPDRAVLIDEAMTLLGMTRDYIYRHWKRLGGYRDDDGHVKFLMSVIRRHLNTRAS